MGDVGIRVEHSSPRATLIVPPTRSVRGNSLRIHSFTLILVYKRALARCLVENMMFFSVQFFGVLLRSNHLGHILERTRPQLVQ